MKKFTFIDLFAGIGGFRYALESFGGECVFTSEWDKFAKGTYEANFGEIPKGDITKIDEKDIPAHDIICAGFPCQAFSISGKQKGFEDTRGTLFFDVARIAEYHKPKILFLENVKNFARHDNGKTLEVIVATLEEIGYKVFYKVLNASHYGSPTSRQRIYIVCFRNDLGVKTFNFPQPNMIIHKVRDYLDKDVPKDFYIEREDILINEEKVKKAKDNNLPVFKPIQVGKINKGGQGERIYSIDGHAITLSAYGGGAAAKTGAYLMDDGKIRKLTPTECARIMGFPDNFIIRVPKIQAYKQFGNSVAIPVLKEITNQFIKYL